MDQFVRQRRETQQHTHKTGRSLLSLGSEWQLAANLDCQLKFPPEITTSPLCPDIVLWLVPARVVIMVELTVLWEEEMEAAYERKERYAELSAVCLQAGWRAFTFPVEVGCRDFTGTSTQWLLKTLGVTGPKRKRTLQDLAEETE